MTAREAKLRALAAHHNLELAGLSLILWPREPTRLEALREAWILIEPEARAGTLAAELAWLNFDRCGPGWRPHAYWLWSASAAEYAAREGRISTLAA